MKFLEKLDLAILDGIFQPIADWVQDTWGKSCYWLTKTLFWLAIAVRSALAIATAKNDGNSFGKIAFELTYTVMIGLWLLYNIHLLEKMDGDQSLRTPTANPWRPHSLPRLILLFVAVFTLPLYIPDIMAGTLEGYLSAARTFLWIPMIYFFCCTPRPPKPLKASNKLAVAASPAR